MTWFTLAFYLVGVVLWARVFLGLKVARVTNAQAIKANWRCDPEARREAVAIVAISLLWPIVVPLALLAVLVVVVARVIGGRNS